MAAHSNDKTILGNGLDENVRSYNLERTIDFGVTGPLDSSKYYEIGTLPYGFVPRNVAILQLTPFASSGTAALYKTVEDSASGTATKIIEISAVSSGALATAFCPFDPGTVSSTTATVTPSMGAQLAVKIGTTDVNYGRFKVVISGDRMAGVWDEGEKDPPIVPKDTVPKTVFTSEHSSD